MSQALLGPEVAATLGRHEQALEAVQRQLAEMAAASSGQLGAQDLEPLLAWIRGAEAHLGALQGDHERLRDLHRRQSAQLDRVTARTANLHDVVGDLQRIDTEIALTLARRRSPEQ